MALVATILTGESFSEMRGNGDGENESQVKNVYRIQGSTEYLTE